MSRMAAMLAVASVSLAVSTDPANAEEPSAEAYRAFCSDPAKTAAALKAVNDDKNSSEAVKAYAIRYLLKRYDSCGSLADPDMKVAMDALGVRTEAVIQRQQIGALEAQRSSDEMRHEEEMRASEARHAEEMRTLRQELNDKIMEERALDDIESQQAIQRALRERQP